jgi:hypothetical protein
MYFLLAPPMGRLVIFNRVYPGQARCAVQPWADILRTVGARLTNGV